MKMRFFIMLCTVVGALLVLYVWNRGQLFTFQHLLLFTLCSIPLCLLFVYLIEKIGSNLGGGFLGWRPRKISARETFSADLEKARHNKRQGRYKEALKGINNILAEDADFPEALYLKAQILYEGFGNNKGAGKYLKMIMQKVDKDEPIYHWASNLYNEMRENDSP